MFKNNFKSTGIVRKIDDLGRIVIPKEIIKTLGIQKHSPMKICIDSMTKEILIRPATVKANLVQTLFSTKDLIETDENFKKDNPDEYNTIITSINESIDIMINLIQNEEK